MDPMVMFVFFFASKIALIGGLAWIAVRATLRFEELKRERMAREAAEGPAVGAAVPAGETTEPVAEPVPVRRAA